MEEVAFDKLSVEQLAEQIHKVYCKYHLEIRGSEYWTKGNYDLLDEKTKEADRYMARFIKANYTHNQSVDKNKKSCTEIVGNIYLDILKIQRRLDKLEGSNLTNQSTLTSNPADKTGSVAGK